MTSEGYKEYLFKEKPLAEMTRAARVFRQSLEQRRSIREFSDRKVPAALIEDLLMSASTAPSGANKQPWTFCAISDPRIKCNIREAAEKEEYENYHNRMSDQWLKDLEPLGTDWKKPFLEIAPWLIAVFKKPFELDEKGNKVPNYYVNESVGLACGLLIVAIHQAGLVSLTHTPSPMNFLAEVLDRPANERPFLLIPVGYPARDVQVPDIQKKSVQSVIEWYTGEREKE